MVSIVLVATAFFSLLSCGQKEVPKVAKIGVLFPMTGPTENTANWVKTAVEMAIEDVNNKGGAAGYRFEAVFADDRSKPFYAGRLAEKLITEEKVDFLMGTLSSEVAIRVSEISQKHKKLFIGTSPSSSTLGIEYFQPYWFNLRTSSFMSSAALAKFLKDLRATRDWYSIATIAPDYTFGHTVIEEIQHNLRRFKVDHRMNASFWPKLYTRDFDPFITAILRDKPDILVVELYSADLRTFFKQGNLRNLFENMVVCAFISGSHYDNFSALKDEVPLGMFVSGANFLNWPDTEEKRNLIERARQRGGGSYPSASFEEAYQAVRILATAVEKAGSPRDSDALAGILEKLHFKTSKNTEGTTSHIYPGTHEIAQAVIVGQVVEDKRFPPATRMPGNWRVYHPDELLPPMEYIMERRRTFQNKPATATEREERD